MPFLIGIISATIAYVTYETGNEPAEGSLADSLNDAVSHTPKIVYGAVAVTALVVGGKLLEKGIKK
jgi:hypothetical protein